MLQVKYYNDSPFHRVERDFIAMAGRHRTVKNPAQASGAGPTIWSLINEKFVGVFDGKEPYDSIIEREGMPDSLRSGRRHDIIGVVATANEKMNQNGACFYITLSPRELESLNNRHTIFGYVVEGVDDVLVGKINKVPVDNNSCPLQTIRIRHTLVLEDPFEDPPHLERLIPAKSPEPIKDADFVEINTVEDELRMLERIASTEARSRAIELEILGDVPDADMKPPNNVLFVCKLNPYTEEEDLETIFSQFGKILSCKIIKDWKTGDSLQYAFIEFADHKSCENAYFKMKDVLVDDRRIHVDFCQSVSQQWIAFKTHGDRATRQDAIAVNNASQQNASRAKGGEWHLHSDQHGNSRRREGREAGRHQYHNRDKDSMYQNDDAYGKRDKESYREKDSHTGRDSHTRNGSYKNRNSYMEGNAYRERDSYRRKHAHREEDSYRRKVRDGDTDREHDRRRHDYERDRHERGKDEAKQLGEEFAKRRRTEADARDSRERHDRSEARQRRHYEGHTRYGHDEKDRMRRTDAGR